MSSEERTTCCVIGGGPAGMVLGLLLARAGVEVTVLEKHGDFLRDFRGDTVHPSTLTLLDELGLGEQFAKLPQSHLEQLQFPAPDDGPPLILGDFTRLSSRHRHRYVAMVPQWDLLDLLASAGEAEPTYRLRMNTEATGLLKENGRVTGVRYRTPDGATGELRADLTVACDGRTSVLRTDAGLRPHEYHVPIDTWWFRLPKKPTERGNGLTVRMRGGEIGLTLDRDAYFQVAYLAKKGVDATIRAEGVQHFRDRIANLMPQLADRVDAIAAMDDVKVLDVKLNRLRKWYKKGLLCIGDAAHAMSPIGGVGINVAVQDAVATARILAGPLLAGRVTESDLARVQVTRWLPTVVIQGLQRLMHGGLIGPAVRGERTSYPRLPLMLTSRFPALRVVPAYIVGIGPRPEHAPEFARRAPTSTS